jgi:phage shock protein A
LDADRRNAIILFMGTHVFNNEIFDSWLNKKSDEILSKVDREKISTEEMIVLVLKAQTNHFHHMDVDMKKGLSDLGEKFREVGQRFEVIDQKFEKMDQKFEKMDQKFVKMDEKFERMDQKFEKMDQKIDNRFMWMIGITIAMSGGIYLKLFFH